MSAVINIKDLSFSYNDTKPVLQIPHLSFTKNETVFLFGASGSGKTTLLEILAGVITGQKGEVEMLGEKTQHSAYR